MKRVTRIAAVLAAAVLLLALALWVALELRSVQTALLGVASRMLEERAGLRLEAEGVDLDLLPPAVVLVGPSLRAAEGEPLLAAEAVSAVVDGGALLRRRLVVREVRIDRPRLDLRRPLPPERSASEPQPPAAAPAFELRSLVLRDGTVVGGPVPEALSAAVDAWRAEGIDVEASYVGGEIAAALEGLELVVDPVERPPVALHATARVRGPALGPLELEELRAAGAGLEAELSGTVGLGDDQPLTLRGTLAGDGAELLGTSTPLEVSAAAELDLRRAAGKLRLSAPAVAAEALEPWLEEQTWRRLGVAGSELSLHADLDLGPGSLARLDGEVAVVWSRGGEVLADLEAEPRPAVSEPVAPVEPGRVVSGAGAHAEPGGARAVVPFVIRVLPDSSGLREVRGTVRLTDWGRPAAAELRDVRIRLESGDLAAAGRELQRVFPELVTEELVARLPLTGNLEAEATLDGPVADPETRASASWRPRPRTRVHLTASGRPLRREGGVPFDVVVEVEALPLELFSELGGRRSGSLGGSMRLSGSTERWSGDFDLRGEELVVAEGAAPLDLFELSGRVDPQRLAVSRLRLERRELAVEAEATVTAHAEGVALVAPRIEVAGAVGRLEVDLPPAWAARLPLLGARFTRPAAGDSGPPVVVRAQIPEAEWGELLPLAALDSLRAGLLAELRLEPTRPLAATGELLVPAMEATVAGRRVSLEGPARLGLDGFGTLRLDPVRLRGEDGELVVAGALQLDPEWQLGSPWTEALTSLEASAAGHVEATLLGTILELPGEVEGPVEIELEAAGPVERPGAVLRLAGAGASWTLPGGGPRLAEPMLSLRLDERVLEIEELSLRIGELPLAARGSAQIVDEGLRLELPRLALGERSGSLEALVPLGLLSGSGATPEGTLRLAWEVPPGEWLPVLRAAGAGASEEWQGLHLGSRGELELDLAAPAAGRLDAAVTELRIGVRERQLHSTEPLRLRLDDGRLRLEEATLGSGEQTFRLGGEVVLDRDWRPGDPLSALGRTLELDADGSLAAALFNPFLAGGAARGIVELELRFEGPATAPRGLLRLRGPEAQLLYPRPYLTRISDPDLELRFEGGGTVRLAGGLTLNEGEVRLSGAAEPGGVLVLDGEFSGVRYLFDYGLTALLDAELTLARSADGDFGLGGDLVVENGILTRNVDLDLQFIEQLLAPPDLTSTAESPLEAVDLDLSLSTIEGVRIKNNVADLAVFWDPIKVRGTLAAPVLDGRLEVEPGGRIFAFGQTVRLDRATIIYPGDPLAPAELDLATTTSIEDPTIVSLSGEDLFARADDVETSREEAWATAAAGFTGFYGEQLFGKLTEPVGGASISLEPPLLIFGEENPGARLTVTQELSPQVSLAASTNLREAESRTYLLDLHELRGLPNLNTQFYTNDEAAYGTALRQRLRFGGTDPRPADALRLRRLRVDRVPEGTSRRGLRRATGFGKGDRIEERDLFPVEVEVIGYLGRHGYVDPRVEAELVPLPGGRRAELRLSLQPGPRATYVFEGDRLPKVLRRSVEVLYRSDFFEESSLAEMEEQAVAAFRSRGHLSPEVTVTARPADPGDPDGDRVVTVTSVAGERIDPGPPVFEGVPADESDWLAARFESVVSRVELVAGEPFADRRVEQLLSTLGYPEGRVVGRDLSEDGKRLSVLLEPGERLRIAALEVHGVDAETRGRLEEAGGLEVGDPLRFDRVGAAARDMRRELESQGYADAEVRTAVEPAGDDPLGRRVRFEAKPGPSYVVSDVGFEGLVSTRERWARSVANLPTDETFYEESLYAARRRLQGVGVFSRVTPTAARGEDGTVDIAFTVAERRRYELAYGLRWDSDEGAGVVLEAIDRNSLGRALTTGLRLQYSDDLESARALLRVPWVGGPRTSLEFFTLASRETDDLEGLFIDTAEATAQVSHDFGARLDARAYARYREQRVREIDPDPFLPFDVRTQTPILGLQAVFDTRPKVLLPKRGLLATADLSYSDEAFGSDFNFVRLFAQAGLFQRVARIGGSSLTWAHSYRLGLAEALGGGLLPPLDESFTAGGEYSVRGYATDSIVPTEDLGAVTRRIPAEALLVVNQELRLSVGERFTPLVFFDAGNTWASSTDLELDLLKSVGVGLRAESPIGLLRLDLAHALDGREGIDPEYKLYVGFGTTF